MAVLTRVNNMLVLNVKYTYGAYPCSALAAAAVSGVGWRAKAAAAAAAAG